MDAVSIVNMALDQIGSKANVQSINPPLPANDLAAQVAGRIYQTQVDAVFRAAHWGCLRAQAPLTLLRAAGGTQENPNGSKPTPPSPWRYSYGLPSDCLKVRFLIPTSSAAGADAPQMTGARCFEGGGAGVSLPFVTAVGIDAGDNQIPVILSNAEGAQIVYTARIANPDLWDASLRNAVIATLAAWFVNPLSRNKELLGERVQIARSLIEAARVSDGNEGITSTDTMPDWMRVRGFEGFAPELTYGCVGYDAISFSNGVSF